MIGTLPEARGLGLGETCVKFVCDEAFSLGTQAVILQTSPVSEAWYRKIGFRELSRYHWYPINFTTLI